MQTKVQFDKPLLLSYYNRQFSDNHSNKETNMYIWKIVLIGMYMVLISDKILRQSYKLWPVA